ncbi:MAG: AraC family transcriptional regulator [Aphanocapsa sp. GSE-SYN-MK-11-07L]|jgi:AraC-like DNA-binding protein|nr:AraC family transcriptional regulator [Aphanocapsa sp. GSE-SYN-MK-11-07L]
MPYELTDSIVNELWQESEQKGQAAWADTDTEAIDWATLPHIGRLWQCHMPLQEGLELEIQEWEMLEALWHNGSSEKEPDLGFGLTFCLSGKVTTQIHGLTDEIEEPIGYYNFCSHSEFRETEHWQAGEPFRRLYLGVNPFQVFADYTPQQRQQLPRELQQILAGDRKPFFHYRVITPEMFQVVQQILLCPYSGMFKRIYLQAKAQELMLLALLPFVDGGSKVAPSKLTPDEVDCLHRAKNILINQLAAPPTLKELAQKAQLNQRTLNEGFQQTFGTTVFQYLSDHRLGVARQLLTTGDLRIEEVAQQVGFAHRGYFARAFRKKFGFSPKAYRQQHKKSGE